MLVFPIIGEGKAPGNQENHSLNIIFTLHRSELSIPPIYGEYWRHFKRVSGIHVCIYLTSEKGAFHCVEWAHVLESMSALLKHWMSAVPALLLAHSDPIPQEQENSVLVRCTYQSEPVLSGPANRILQECCTWAEQFCEHWLWGNFRNTKPVHQGPIA